MLNKCFFIQGPFPSTSNEDSGSVFASQTQSQSILTSETNTKTVVQQTEDESGDDGEEDESDGSQGSPRSNSPASPQSIPLNSAATNYIQNSGDAATAPVASTSNAGNGDVEEEEEEEEVAGRRNPEEASLFVTDEIRNCQHQINVATIALEQLRKVIIIFLKNVIGRRHFDKCNA